MSVFQKDSQNEPSTFLNLALKFYFKLSKFHSWKLDYCVLYLVKEILNFQESQVKSFETHLKSKHQKNEKRAVSRPDRWSQPFYIYCNKGTSIRDRDISKQCCYVLTPFYKICGRVNCSHNLAKAMHRK
eukprot:sb/3475234/